MAAYVASIPTSSRMSLRSISPRRPISRSSINIRSSSHSCDGVKASTPVLLEPINKGKVNLSGYDEIGIGSPPEAICGLPELKTLAESSEFFPPLTEGKLGQETIRPEEDHINLAPQDSVPKPAGKESHPSSFKETVRPEEDHIKKEAHINLAPQDSIAKPNIRELLESYGNRMTAFGFEKEESMLAAFLEDPSTFKGKIDVIMEEVGRRGMLEILGQKNTVMGTGLQQSQRRISRDYERMFDDEILKNDQEASFASCRCSKQVRDLSGCCCRCSTVVCYPPVGSSCRCSNTRDLSGCYCRCSNVLHDSPVGSSRQRSNMRDPSDCYCRCSNMLRDSPVGSSCRCSNVRPSGCCCQCSSVRDSSFGSSCRFLKEGGFYHILCVVGFMLLVIIILLSQPGCRYCY